MSKQCPNCQNMLPDDASFCNMCGMQFANSQQGNEYQGYGDTSSQQGNGYQNEYASAAQQAQYQNISYQTADGVVVEQGETVVAELKDSPILSTLIGGGINKTEAFFTDRRLYMKEKGLSLIHGLYTKDDIINLSDVSGTKIMQTYPVRYMVMALIFFIAGILIGSVGFVICLILAVIQGVCFFIKRGLEIQASYPGGTSRCLIHNCSYDKGAEFHKKLRIYIQANQR